MGEDTVTITKQEYEHLIKQERWLDALEAAGVDNWNGYDEARDILKEWDEADLE